MKLNVFQSIAIWVLIVVVFLTLFACTHYDLDNINHTVNRYGYLSDEEYGHHGVKLVTPTQKGDCEDQAYTKCLMVKAKYPEKETYYLYKSISPTLAHAALAVDGMVLDNIRGAIYPYNPAEWTYTMYWECEKQTLGTDRQRGLQH